MGIGLVTLQPIRIARAPSQATWNPDFPCLFFYFFGYLGFRSLEILAFEFYHAQICQSRETLSLCFHCIETAEPSEDNFTDAG